MTQKALTYNLLVRFPADMKDAIHASADADARSINGLVVTAVRQYLANAQADRVSRFAMIGGFAGQTPLAEREGSEAGAVRG